MRTTNHSILFFLGAALAILPGCAKNPVPADIEEIVFTAEHYTFANAERPYRKAEINLNDDVIPAIVVYLHGGSTRGTDNEKQMQEPGILSIATYLQEKGISAIFLVPQCPETDTQGKAMAWTKMGKAVEYLIGTERSCPQSPVYLLGGSMGGTGTWNLLSAYPDLFTAAMACAGNPRDCNPVDVAKTPVYAVMGGADKVMKPEEVNLQAFLDEISAASGQFKFDTEEGWDHEKTCTDSYTSFRLEWVFSHN